MPTIDVTTWYLELLRPSALRPAAADRVMSAIGRVRFTPTAVRSAMTEVKVSQDMPEQAFLMAGPIEDVVENAESMK